MEHLALDFGHHTRFILLAYGIAGGLFVLYLLLRWLKRRRIMRDVTRAASLAALSVQTQQQVNSSESIIQSSNEKSKPAAVQPTES